MRWPAAEKFDESREFEVRKPITAQGERFKPGADFDKSLVSTRRLRLLWEQGWLAMRPAIEAKPLSPMAALIAKADEMRFFRFRAEAAALLGGDAPAKKPDIIAALQAQDGQPA